MPPKGFMSREIQRVLLILCRYMLKTIPTRSSKVAIYGYLKLNFYCWREYGHIMGDQNQDAT